MGWVFNPFLGNFDKTGTGSGPGVQFWEEITSATLSASATVDINLGAESSIYGGKVYLVTYNESEDSMNNNEIIFHNLNATVSDVLTRTSSSQIAIELLVSSGNIIIRVTNNEIFDVNYHGHFLTY